MITHVRIQNFRSFLDASVDLQPFSLVVGANGSGKTNFLRFFQAVSTPRSGDNGVIDDNLWVRHQLREKEWRKFELYDDAEEQGLIEGSDEKHGRVFPFPKPSWFEDTFPLFNIKAEDVSAAEPSIPNPAVYGSGAGTCQVLDGLKNGDREDLFDAVEQSFCRYVPEVIKLSFKTVRAGVRQIQVREKGLPESTPASELSEGTRLILCILTILHQENPPRVILLEDIDRGMHPRLFEHVAPLMRDIAERHGINIIATSHNPYLVDCFRDTPEAVIIVEKEDGASTLTTLAKRLEEIDYDSVDPDDAPLGQLWYSGIVGGVPVKKEKAKA